MTFEFIFIDTVGLVGLMNEETGEYKPVDHVAANAQYAWIQDTLENSTADYLWLVGHFPVWSVCDHGKSSAHLMSSSYMIEVIGVHSTVASP